MRDFDNLTEISLKTPKGDTEYRCNAIPRINETINIDTENVKGEFQVVNVTHKIFDSKEYKCLSYVIVTCV